MVEYSLCQVLIEYGIQPSYVLGSSLGEFCAAAIAGILSAEEIIGLIIEHAILIERYCPKGGMLAILHDPDLYERDYFIHNNTELASINYDNHFVISGSNESLLTIEHQLKDKGIISQRLPVSYAFHSSFIKEAENEYLKKISGISMSKPKMKFVSSLYGNLISDINETYFWNIAKRPILFRNAIQTLEYTCEKLIYIDLGPAPTLSGFINKIISSDSTSKTYAVLSPFGQDIKNLNNLFENLIS
jgi:trans-AT polyketide synthase, acyltransferase and oxidoreductase domains